MDEHRRAGRMQPPRDRRAHAARAAGDERAFAFQRLHVGVEF